MIYWFTGQPSHGKSVLADLLKDYFIKEEGMNLGANLFRIDGDDLRDLFANKDYTIHGRIANVNAAQKIAHYLHNRGAVVIVSLVSPYLDQREEFKAMLGDSITEIYVHTVEPRERDHFAVKAYQAPVENFIDIDTTHQTPEESLREILQCL